MGIRQIGRAHAQARAVIAAGQMIERGLPERRLAANPGIAHRHREQRNTRRREI